MITRKQFDNLLALQVDTNHAYYGEQWREVWSLNASRNSVYREWAELLDEVEAAWHCYKPNPTFNIEAAVFELTDITHFMLSMLLISDSEVALGLDLNYPYTTAPGGHSFDRVETLFTEFMRHPGIYNMVRFLEAACQWLQINDATYLNAHMLKNARNRLRAAGNVVDGEYDKSKEAPLVLELIDEPVL